MRVVLRLKPLEKHEFKDVQSRPCRWESLHQHMRRWYLDLREFWVDVCQWVGRLFSIFFGLCFPNLFYAGWRTSSFCDGFESILAFFTNHLVVWFVHSHTCNCTKKSKDPASNIILHIPIQMIRVESVMNPHFFHINPQKDIWTTINHYKTLYSHY